MKHLFFFITTLFSLNQCATLSAQNPPSTEALLAEAKLLFESERASWLGTGIFMKGNTAVDLIGGYFSYPVNEGVTCLFYSKGDVPQVLATISFDRDFNVGNAKTEHLHRPFTDVETDYYLLRSKTQRRIESDTTFERFSNSNFKFVPIITSGNRRVYIMTAPSRAGVVIFGNDYLMHFDEKNEIKSIEKLHQGIVPIQYQPGSTTPVEMTMHSHTEETGDMMTATDICTLMLYAERANWQAHAVAGPIWISVWDCIKQTLKIAPVEKAKKK